MSRIRALFFISLLILTSDAIGYAAKEGNISATVGLLFTKTNFSGSETTPSSPILGSFALIANGDLNDSGALEIGLIHMRKTFYRQEELRTIGEQLEVIQMTMGYRHQLGPLWAASLTFSSSYAMSSPETIHSDFSPGQELPTSARDVTEYGLVAALEHEFWSEDRLSAVANFRYTYSFTNKENERGDQYGALIGLRYLIQQKGDDIRKTP
jgi:hypothetical protein